jgi:virginiamycin B lyase
MHRANSFNKLVRLLCFTLLFCSPVRAEIGGTGSLEGTVSAPKPLVAAKMIIRNVDRKIVYAVYTEKGRFTAVNLFPGKYEVSIDKRGFSGPAKTVEIVAGKRATMELAVQSVVPPPRYVGGRVLPGAVAVPYDILYPKGEGREILERTCIICHGVNFIPVTQLPKAGWEAMIRRMTHGNAFGNPGGESQVAPERLSAKDVETLSTYLGENFGPGKPKRAVLEEAEPVLDEAVLGKAMFMVYEFPNVDGMDRYTQEVHFDTKGNVWIAQPRSPGSIIRLDPRTGAYRDYQTPDPRWAPHSVAVDKDDTVWYTGAGNRLAHLDPNTGFVDLYPVLKKGEHGIAVVFDTSGNAYFTALQGNQIGKWDRKTDTTTMYQNPTPRGRPYGMLVDRNDKVWYAQFHGCIVTRFDPATERFTEFPALSQPCTMRRFGVDSQGRIWFGLWSNAVSQFGRIGVLEPKTGKIIEFTVPLRFSNPYDTWVDNEDNVWITSDNHLIRYEPKAKKFSFYPLIESHTDVPKLSVTREGALWYAPRGLSFSRGGPASAAVFYPDKNRMTTFGAYFADDAVENRIRRYRGPDKKVANTAPKIMRTVPEFHTGPVKRDIAAPAAD